MGPPDTVKADEVVLLPRPCHIVFETKPCAVLHLQQNKSGPYCERYNYTVNTTLIDFGG
jgi:hypothetical protein